MSQVGEDENLKLEHRLSFLSLVGSIAPMVGLLGTVDGMVASFQVIAMSDTQPKPSQLAQGISMALITTLVGLLIAIPAIIAFNLLKNHLTRLVMETGQLCTNLMAQFETGEKVASMYRPSLTLIATVLAVFVLAQPGRLLPGRSTEPSRQQETGQPMPAIPEDSRAGR
jgi:hypothetical protein